MVRFAEYLNEHPEKARRLKQATGGRCENCSNPFPPAVLEIHLIGKSPETGVAGQDLQKRLLVLCRVCCDSFRSGQVGESLQRELVRHRSREVRNRMRENLGYRPRDYIPPDTPDPEVVFREIFDGGAPDLCLNGG